MGWPKGVPRNGSHGVVGSYSDYNARRTPEKKQADLIRSVEKAYLNGAQPMLTHVALGGCAWCDLLAVLHGEQYDLTVLRLTRRLSRLYAMSAANQSNASDDLTYTVATA